MSFSSSLLTVVLAFGLCTTSWANNQSFPMGPDQNLTPGSFCHDPDTYRYPEKIPYCERNVDTWTKKKVFRDYIEKLGYKIDMKKRSHYKVDHLIPLCAGGSNEIDNLWPQHSTVYKRTDEIEMVACIKMAEGRVTQRKAVDLILEAKKDLGRAKDILFQFKKM